MFSLFNFSSIFQGGSADPICPYVRTPTDVTSTLYKRHLKNKHSGHHMHDIGAL